MDSWLLVFVSLLLSTGLSLLIRWNHRSRRSKPPLPPGPLALPIIGNPVWFTRWSVTNIEHHLRHDLHPRYGPIVSVRIGSRLSVFISDSSLAHEALIQHGAALADRLPSVPALRILNSNQHNVAGAAYGPLWRALRRNLASEILHPSRYTKLYSPARRWVLDLLLRSLRDEAGPNSGAVVRPDNHFQFAMFSLLVLMCFGEKLDGEAIRKIETAQRQRLLHVRKLDVLRFAPWITAPLFRGRVATAVGYRQAQERLYLPLIEARRRHKVYREEGRGDSERFVYSYVDSLLDLHLPEEEGGRKLTDDEVVTLASEFLIGGTDTTATALQWIMAELVRQPEIQRRMAEEMKSALGPEATVVEEGDMQRLPYLRAVVMEGLRRHPPAHFVIPHAAAEEITVGGYRVPKGTAVNFVVGEMNWDERAWKDPMEFRPERFLEGGEGEGVDITGNREITMLPFGAGRRICPGIALAMLHLQFLVGNLVREFHWRPAAEGEDVDLSEKTEFTVVMKYPLRATIVPRHTFEEVS